MDDREDRIAFAAFAAHNESVGRLRRNAPSSRERWETLGESSRQTWLAVAEAVAKEVGGIY